MLVGVGEGGGGGGGKGGAGRHRCAPPILTSATRSPKVQEGGHSGSREEGEGEGSREAEERVAGVLIGSLGAEP